VTTSLVRGACDPYVQASGSGETCGGGGLREEKKRRWEYQSPELESIGLKGTFRGVSWIRTDATRVCDAFVDCGRVC
jgi:hypothetical protein